jgi:hypothetical protein
MTCQIPVITVNTIIGTVLDENSRKHTPIRFRDLTNMTDYHHPYTFRVAKEHDPVTHIGLSVHTVMLDGGEMYEIAGTFSSGTIDKLVLNYFDENVWVNCSKEYTPEDKWQMFGYFMTDNAKKHLGGSWNDNCLYYWSDVAATLQ